MQLIYAGVDITEQTKIGSAVILDNAGGKADSLSIVFSDPENWDQWKPAFGDKIRVLHNGFDTGSMWVDDWRRRPSAFAIKALSLPLSSKTAHTRTWRDIKLLSLAFDVAAEYGLTLKHYNAENYLYANLEQNDETDIAFLARVCSREAYAVKVVNEQLVIFDERAAEWEMPQITVSSPEDFDLGATTSGLRSACVMRYMDLHGNTIEYTLQAPGVVGSVLKINERMDSPSEAERWSHGYLRAANKLAAQGWIVTPFQSGIAAGNTVSILGVGRAEGYYYVDHVDHRPVVDRSILYVRRPLGGY